MRRDTSTEATREDPRRGECSHLHSRSCLVSGSLGESVHPALDKRIPIWTALVPSTDEAGATVWIWKSPQVQHRSRKRQETVLDHVIRTKLWTCCFYYFQNSQFSIATLYMEAVHLGWNVQMTTHSWGHLITFLVTTWSGHVHHDCKFIGKIRR